MKQLTGLYYKLL